MRGPTFTSIDFMTQTRRGHRVVFRRERQIPKKVLLYSISEMELPSSSSSNTTPCEQTTETEMETTQSSRKRRYPDEDNTLLEHSAEPEENIRNYFAEHAQQGLRQPTDQRQPEQGTSHDRGSFTHMGSEIKKKKLNCGHAQNIVIYINDDTSSSSNISISSLEELYVEPRYVAPTSENYPNINPSNYFESGPMTYKNEENFMYGYWIQFTNILGGWSYKFVKLFLRRQLGLTCWRGRPVPGTQPAKGDFRIIVRLGSKEERDRILEYLLTKHVSHYFTYSVIDKLPVGSYDTDTDNEDDDSSPMGGVLQRLD